MISNYSKDDINEIYKMGNKLNDKFSKLYDLNNLNDLEEILVFKENNRIYGFIHYLNNVDYQEVLNIFVKEEYRKKGIGSLLISFLKGNVLLEVKSSNKAAISFYEKLNFKKINIRKNYYKEEDAVVMERKHYE